MGNPLFHTDMFTKWIFWNWKISKPNFKKPDGTIDQNNLTAKILDWGYLNGEYHRSMYYWVQDWAE